MFKQNGEYQTIFEKAKSDIMNTTEFKFLDRNKRFVLETDVSDTNTGNLKQKMMNR